jgi:hypothetical protein
MFQQLSSRPALFWIDRQHAANEVDEDRGLGRRQVRRLDEWLRVTIQEPFEASGCEV